MTSIWSRRCSKAPRSRRRRLGELFVHDGVAAKPKRFALDDQHLARLARPSPGNRVLANETLVLVGVARRIELTEDRPQGVQRLLEALPCPPERRRFLARDVLLDPTKRLAAASHESVNDIAALPGPRVPRR